MAVSIDDLHVQTQAASPPAEAPASGAAKQPQPDFKAEMEKLRERELRLQAD